MKRLLIAAVISIALLQTSSYAQVDANAAKAGAKEHGCLNCHNIDTKKVGPAWQDSAAKFKGKKAGDLAASIKAKPVHAASAKKAGEKDLNLMSEWILTLGK